MQTKKWPRFEADGGAGGSGTETATQTAHTGILDPITPTSTPATWTTDTGEFSPGWVSKIEGLTPEQQAGLTKFKTVPDLAKSNFELQQLLGKKGNQVAVPNEKSTPEEVSAYRKVVGVPEKLEEYKFKPDQIPEGVEWSDELMASYAKIAHENNIPPAVMQKLAAAQVQLEAQRNGVFATQFAERDNQEKEALGKAWGEDFSKNALKVKAAAQLVGADPGIFTSAAQIQAFHQLASMLSDSTLKIGEAAATFQNGEGLAKDIMTNPQNPDHAAYQANDKTVRNKVHALLRQQK